VLQWYHYGMSASTPVYPDVDLLFSEDGLSALQVCLCVYMSACACACVHVLNSAVAVVLAALHWLLPSDSPHICFALCAPAPPFPKDCGHPFSSQHTVF